MTKSILFISANPIRSTDQLNGVLSELSAQHWKITLWSYYVVPDSINRPDIKILGPQKPWQPKKGMHSSNSLVKLIQLGVRIVRALWRKISNRTRRDRVWWTLKNDQSIEKVQPTLIVAIDTFATFSVWKLIKRMKGVIGLANLTSVLPFATSTRD